MVRENFLELEDVIRKIVKKMPVVWKRHIKLGFSRSEAMVLYKLNKEGQQRASELANTLSITTGGLTGVIDKLVDGGYVQRKRDDNDRRVVYLTITDKGTEAFEIIYASRQSFIDTIFNGLSEAELDQLSTIANKVLANLEENEKNQSKS